MSAIRIHFPIQTLDGCCLLPAGALVTTGALRELASSRPEAARKETPFMSYGTVREDLARGVSLSDRRVELIAACDALISSRPCRPASFENRAALEELTEMARKGPFEESVIRALIALNRRSKPRPAERRVSREKRGQPPGGNLYGVVVDDADASAERRGDV